MILFVAWRHVCTYHAIISGKKGSLRLCIGYRELNKKAVPHRVWVVKGTMINAHLLYSRVICLTGLRDVVCIAYPDLLLFGKTFEKQLENVKKVLQRLKSWGIKLKAIKSKFFQTEIKHLGRLISKNGYKPDPDDTWCFK